jgi:hypothetical protein
MSKNFEIKLGERRPYSADNGHSEKDFFQEILVDFPGEPEKNASFGWYAQVHRTDRPVIYRRVLLHSEINFGYLADESWVGVALAELEEFFASKKQAIDTVRSFLERLYGN